MSYDYPAGLEPSCHQADRKPAAGGAGGSGGVDTMAHQHPQLPSEVDFEEETFEESMARFSGFGKDLFFKLESHFPAITTKIRFFRRCDSQSDDIWAVYDDRVTQFGIQLEPNTPVIVLWNDEPGNHIEIGDWSEDTYGDAIRIIKEVFFAAGPSQSLPFGWWW